MRSYRGLAVVLVPALAIGAASWLLVERTLLALATRGGRSRARVGARLEARAAP